MNKKNLIGYLTKKLSSCDTSWKRFYRLLIQNIDVSKCSATGFMFGERCRCLRKIQIFKNAPNSSVIIYFYENKISVIDNLINLVKSCNF